MRSVVSMDSEGIWNACTINVIAKTAITTVETKDCSDVSQESLGCGTAGAVWVTGIVGCSTAVSGVMLNPPDRGRGDAHEDVRAPVRRPVARPVFWWKLRRAQHIQAHRPCAVGYGLRR